MHAPAAPHLPAACRRAGARLLLVLALALVLAQALGLMHRITHFAPAMGGARLVQPADHWVNSLFAGHDTGAECRVFDALGHDGAAPVASVPLPLALSSFFLACFQGDFVARWSALFDARGPPAPR